MNKSGQSPSSFRDPSGFVFYENGQVFRQVNRAYSGNYKLLFDSGLYGRLVESEALIPHAELPVQAAHGEDAYKILRPEVIPFISYPYEWCFSQLRDAALLTLDIQLRAMEAGMSLKDASAYNIQFRSSRPIFIDTLSFEAYEEGRPWVAYRQFCEHFLAPLALMAKRDVRLGRLSQVYPNGIPLDLASSLLPFGTFFNAGLLMHIHLHAKGQKTLSSRQSGSGGSKMARPMLQGIIESLRRAVKGLRWRQTSTEWGDYYRDNSYSERAMEDKTEIIAGILKRLAPESVWDLGANTGRFSGIAAAMGINTLAFDLDPLAVEKNFIASREDGHKRMLPLILDLTNPSPGLGWGNRERASFQERGPADLVMALALIHHLAISNNLPFPNIAEFLAGICRVVVLEFVPKSDVQVRRMLETREDIFPGYHEEGLVSAFSRHFRILESHSIAESERKLFLMESLQP